MQILGLEYCADTPIGNNMIRGISGGQKKRVTTGEMIVGCAASVVVAFPSSVVEQFAVWISLSLSQGLATDTAAFFHLVPAEPAAAAVQVKEDTVHGYDCRMLQPLFDSADQ